MGIFFRPRQAASFIEHLEYALKVGRFVHTEAFVRELDPGGWHTAAETRLDCNYGKALQEDEARLQQAIIDAADLIEATPEAKDLLPLGSSGFAEFAFIYHLAIGAANIQTNADTLRQRVALLAAFDGEEEFSLLDGINEQVAAALRMIQQARQTECLLAEFLVRVASAGKPLDRDVMQDFTASVFDALGRR